MLTYGLSRLHYEIQALKIRVTLNLSIHATQGQAVGLPIYGFLLVSNSNNISMSHRLAVMGT